MQSLTNWIGGTETVPDSKLWLDKINPATGAKFYKVPVSNETDVHRAVAAAQAAFPAWARLAQAERSQRLMKLASLVQSKLEVFAEAETHDTGKPLTLARRIDIPRAVHNLQFFAEAALHWSSESHHDQAGLNYTLRTPRGVAGCISPWNLPLYLFTWKIAPALATGNTVVAKPSEVTPMTAALLGSLAREAGFPDGVLNIIHGPGDPTGTALVAHPDVPTITFTGGTATGQAIARLAGPRLKKYSLELGGKNPVMIFDDCNFEQMLDWTVKSSFTNQGEICLCTSRIYVQRGIYAKFKAAFVERVQNLVVGDPLDPATDQGAIVSEPHYNKIRTAIETAQREGGQVLCGGAPREQAGRCRGGFFIAPTVIEGLPPHCATNQKEIFGPVVTLAPFNREEDAMALANDSDYGLAATLWTENLSRAHRMAADLNFGIVWVNTWLMRDLRTPFGGTKQSGVGREGGLEALRFFTEPKNVCINFGRT